MVTKNAEENVPHGTSHEFICKNDYLLPPLSAISDLIRSDTQVSKYFSYAPRIHSAVGGHICFTASMYIHLANCNLKQVRKGRENPSWIRSFFDTSTSTSVFTMWKSGRWTAATFLETRKLFQWGKCWAGSMTDRFISWDMRIAFWRLGQGLSRPAVCSQQQPASNASGSLLAQVSPSNLTEKMWLMSCEGTGSHLVCEWWSSTGWSKTSLLRLGGKRQWCTTQITLEGHFFIFINPKKPPHYIKAHSFPQRNMSTVLCKRLLGMVTLRGVNCSAQRERRCFVAIIFSEDPDNPLCFEVPHSSLSRVPVKQHRPLWNLGQPIPPFPALLHYAFSPSLTFLNPAFS